MATPNQILIDSPTNTIGIQTNDNQLYINSEVCNTEVTVTQPVTTIIQVATPGPQGPQGPKGDLGTSINNQIATGSVTASVNVGSDTFQVTSGSSTFLYINSSGNIGIGTTNPALGLLQLTATTENPNANLVINGGTGGTGSITVRATNGLTGNQKTYNPIGGSDSLNFIQLLDTDTTTTANQPIGRIIFTSNDGDTNEFTTKAFIEAVSEDATPDSFLAFGTNQSGSNTTERLRINSIGNVGIGTTTPKATLDVAGTVVQGQGTNATNLFARAYGLNTTASGQYSNAEGGLSQALGTFTHAEGQGTIALGTSAHAEGINTIASGSGAHAEGNNTIARGGGSHAEGYETLAVGLNSHAEGYGTIANGDYQHTTGQFNITSSAQSAFIIGNGADANNRSNLLFASGSQIQITGSLSVSGLITSANAFVQGGNSFGTTALLGTNDNQNLQFETNDSVRMTISSSGFVGIGTTTPTSTLQVNGSITATNLTITNGSVTATLSPIEGSTGLLLSSNDGSDTRIFTDSITTGINSSGSAPYASAYGSGSKAIGTASFSEGIGSLASGFAAHAAGLNTTASGQAAFSVGIETDADGVGSFAAGSGSNATGTASFAGGIRSLASGIASFAIGSSTTASGVTSLTAGTNTNATAQGSVAFGSSTIAQGVNSFAIGQETTANTEASFAAGIGTFTEAIGQTTVGQWNDKLSDTKNVFLIGGGLNDSTRHNLFRAVGGKNSANGTAERQIIIDVTSPTPELGSNSFFVVSGSSKFITGVNETIELSGPTTITGTNTLSVGGTTTLTGRLTANGAITTTSITASAVSASLVGTSNNVNLQLQANNTTRVFISSSGNVGIGTTTPTERLHVDGNLLVTGRITAEEFHTEFVSASIIYQSGSTQFGNSLDDTHIFTGSLRVDGSITGSLFGTSSWAQNALTSSFITPTGTNVFVQGGNSFGTTALLGTNDDQNLQLETSGSARVHIGNNGNVGIGTTSPISTLTVAGGDININTGYGIGGNNVGSYTPFIRYNTNAGIVSSSFGHTTAYMLSDAGGLFGTNDISFYAGAVTQPEIMRIVGSTGFVGIGKSSPSAKLEIRGSGATSATTALRVENSNASASLTILDDGTSAFNTNHLYVSSSGLVGIGTTTPTAELHISGANDDTLFRVSSPSATNALFVTGSGNVGIGTSNPLSRLHISASSGNEFLRITSGSQNILNVRSGSVVFFAGTGVAPTAGYDLDVQGTGAAFGGSVRFAANGSIWQFGSVSSVNRGATSNSEMFSVTMGGISTTSIQNPMSVTFNANQNPTSGSGYTVLRVNATHATTAGTGSKLLQTWEFAGVQRSVVNITGSIGVGITRPSASVHISSSLGLPPMLTITPHDPLPTTNIPTGTFMVSASVPPRPYMWDGTSWYAL